MGVINLIGRHVSSPTPAVTPHKISIDDRAVAFRVRFPARPALRHVTKFLIEMCPAGTHTNYACPRKSGVFPAFSRRFPGVFPAVHGGSRRWERGHLDSVDPPNGTDVFLSFSVRSLLLLLSPGVLRGIRSDCLLALM